MIIVYSRHCPFHLYAENVYNWPVKNAILSVIQSLCTLDIRFLRIICMSHTHPFYKKVLVLSRAVKKNTKSFIQLSIILRLFRYASNKAYCRIYDLCSKHYLKKGRYIRCI